MRPFITDDARVVGRGQVQLETWIRADAASFQHWFLVGAGPIGPVELTVGGVHGAAYGPDPLHYTITGPVVQAKILLREARPNRLPGLAWAAGLLPPSGVGAFATHGWGFFEYIALTESLGERERVLIHANVGAFGSTDPHHLGVIFTWGIGTQIRTFRALHAVAELFSGDPYVGGGGGATQFGFRYIVSNNVQVDSTFGVGLWGGTALPPWGTVGLRLASNALW